MPQSFHASLRHSSQHYCTASHHNRLRVASIHSDSLQLQYGTIIPGPAASISDFVPLSACLRPERNQGPSQCTRQTDEMAAGLKTIIALSFVCFDVFFLLSPPIYILGYWLRLTTNPLFLGSRHRIPPRHPVLCPLPQLPHSAGRSHLRTRTIAELDMREMCESR